MPVVILSDAFGQTVQKTVEIPQLPFAVFLRPFVSGRHLFGVRLWSTRLLTFLEDDFWKVSVFNTAWFDSGYMLRQFTEAFWFLRLFPVVAQSKFPWFALLRFSFCSTLTRWSTFFVQVQQFSGADVEKTAKLPQLRRFAWTLALHMPVVVQRQVPYGR